MTSTPFPSFLLSSLVLIMAGALKTTALDLGQGFMAGEPTPDSVLLQTRLTEGVRNFDEDLPGSTGFVQFAWWVSGKPATLDQSPWLEALSDRDHIVRHRVTGLLSGTRYRYSVRYSADHETIHESDPGGFMTLPGPEESVSLRLAVITCMNYYKYHYGDYDRSSVEAGVDHEYGYQGIRAIANLDPDLFISTGDTVYFDHPALEPFLRKISQGLDPFPSPFAGREATTKVLMRRKYHEQFSQRNLIALLTQVSSYWQKDDHDYRFDDADPYMEGQPSHESGIDLFREQMPILESEDGVSPTWRTHRVTKDLQIWLTEGRDHRNPNRMPDGPGKSLWGKTQVIWLKQSVLESDARFKVILNPTPLVGPDDAHKNDNHTNPGGFQFERDLWLAWLTDNEISPDRIFFVTGDRHWQYHSQHWTGYHEFSSGTIDRSNARTGRIPGDPHSTDPVGQVTIHYIQDTPDSVDGGFLMIEVQPGSDLNEPAIRFAHYNQAGQNLYTFSPGTQRNQ